jgi:predicted DNA-binding protein (MmcQ/YjbR family)
VPDHERQSPFEEVLALALAYPEAHEDHPWGDTAIKVRGKVFCFLGVADAENRGLTIGVKLPQSHPLALAQPHVSPMRYGLGKAGWVTGIFPHDDLPPMPMIEAWLDESYRAIAPRKLVASLSGYSPGVSTDATIERR